MSTTSIGRRAIAVRRGTSVARRALRAGVLLALSAAIQAAYGADVTDDGAVGTNGTAGATAGAAGGSGGGSGR